MTEPWRAPVPGLEHAAHYVDTAAPERYAGRGVFVVGKRNSGFEVAQGILPWARKIVLGSPRPVQTDALALSALRVRYLHPYDEYARGGPGTYVLDVTIERIERNADGFRVVTQRDDLGRRARVRGRRRDRRDRLPDAAAGPARSSGS